MALIYCRECGKQISDNATACPHCGYTLKTQTVVDPNRSDKDWLTCVLLSFFLGSLGIHSFYVGKTVVGIVQILTLGGCGIWALIDFIMIVCGSYRDAEGKLITNK